MFHTVFVFKISNSKLIFFIFYNFFIKVIENITFKFLYHSNNNTIMKYYYTKQNISSIEFFGRNYIILRARKGCLG